MVANEVLESLSCWSPDDTILHAGKQNNYIQDLSYYFLMLSVYIKVYGGFIKRNLSHITF